MNARAALLVVAAAALAATAATAKPYQLAPWKDDLFAYPRILDTEDNGAYLEVEYNRPRDLYARDEVEGLKVKPQYVDLATDQATKMLTFDTGGSEIKYAAVGATGGKAKAIVVFVHGTGTSFQTGINDWIHGGNFNRIQNLMMRNGSLYLSPSFSDFKEKGTAEVKALILDQAARSPGAPVIVACGSAAGNICWHMLSDAQVAPLLGGLIFFDAAMNDGYIKTAGKLDKAHQVPIHISSSREDTIMGWKSQRSFYRKMKAALPDYPIEYVLFSAGTHGLSLRMTDWRTTLNWMFAVDADRKT